MKLKNVVLVGMCCLLFCVTTHAQEGVKTDEKSQQEKEMAEFMKMMERRKAYHDIHGLKKGDVFPRYTFTDIEGKEVSLSDFKGKYVYIDIWATWCGPCKKEIPFLKELTKRMEGKNIVFVSISIDRDKAAWEKMVKEEKLEGQLHYPGGDQGFFIDACYSSLSSVPRFILLDKEGKVVDPNLQVRPSNEKIDAFLGALEGL